MQNPKFFGGVIGIAELPALIALTGNVAVSLGKLNHLRPTIQPPQHFAVN